MDNEDISVQNNFPSSLTEEVTFNHCGNSNLHHKGVNVQEIELNPGNIVSNSCSMEMQYQLKGANGFIDNSLVIPDNNDHFMMTSDYPTTPVCLENSPNAKTKNITMDINSSVLDHSCQEEKAELSTMNDNLSCKKMYTSGTPQPKEISNKIKSSDISHACNEYLAKESFFCGVCNIVFNTVCQLHNHLKINHSPKKYTFYLTVGTAFPDLELECRYTQTDLRDLIHEKELFDEETDNTEDSYETESFSDALSDNKSVTGCTDKINDLRTTCISKNTGKGDLKLCKKSGEKRYGKRELVNSKGDLNEIEGNEDLKSDVTVAIDKVNRCKRARKYSNKYVDETEDNAVFKQEVVAATEIFGNEEGDLSYNSSNQNFKIDSDEQTDVYSDQQITDDEDTNMHRNMGKSVKRKVVMKKKPKNMLAKNLKSVETKNQDITVTSAQGSDQKTLSEYECDRCNTKYPSMSRLRYHMMKVHSKICDTSKKQCKWCGLTLRGTRSYLAHIRQCNKNENLICFICDKSFATKLEVLEHLVSHKNSQDYSCKFCKKTCDNERSLQHHLRHHNQRKNIQCEHCGKAFLYPYLLTRHLGYCNQEPVIKCDQCDMKFKTTRALDHHKIVHSAERPYVCHICGYAVKKSAYLTRHIRSHTGERPYACSECGVRFSALTGLCRHKKIHSNDKPFTCTYCEKSFTTNWNLKTHLRQHTGDTPYKCDMCGKAFKQNVLLKLHWKTHHP